MSIRCLAFAAALCGLVPGAPASAQETATAPALTAEQSREENAYVVGLQAFLWGYSLRYYGTYINDFRKFPATT
jgi:hypothetical protein